MREAAAAAAPQPIARPHDGWYRRHERLLIGAGSVIGFFILWQLASVAGWISHLFFSSPLEVAQAAVSEVQVPSFWGDVRQSAIELAVAFTAATVVAVPLGLALGWYRSMGDLFDPWVSFFYTLPRIALIPIILLWLGIGVTAITLVVFLGAFFSILLNTIQGARIVDPRLANVARSFHARDRFTFTTLVLPSSVPFILVGLRLGVGRALTGVVIAEMLGGQDGLGRLIYLSANMVQIPRMLFATFLLIVVGVASVETFRRFERRFSTWRDDLSTMA